MDVNLSGATKLYARYNRQRERQPFSIALWGRWSERDVPYPSPLHGDNRSDSVTVGLTHVFVAWIGRVDRGDRASGLVGQPDGSLPPGRVPDRTGS